MPTYGSKGFRKPSAIMEGIPKAANSHRNGLSKVNANSIIKKCENLLWKPFNVAISGFQYNGQNQ
jgi:hypothetical protein